LIDQRRDWMLPHINPSGHALQRKALAESEVESEIVTGIRRGPGIVGASQKTMKGNLEFPPREPGLTVC